ncbi:hypothetical protein TNCV_1868181 [Trichonephila clavipes]|nr:hypothetical protein TNCV_1868181 [Trichonephila clavipes]
MRQRERLPPICLWPRHTGTTPGVMSNDIMQIAFKIVNPIRSRSLQRRQFRVFLEETESDYGDMLLHTDVR